MGPATILLIEDDAALAAAVATSLSSEALGYTVWHVDSAADARAVLRQQRPDVIVLDLSLPDMDGLVLSTHLAAEAPGVPFIVCSHGATAERALAFHLGAADVLVKPFELIELEVRIAAILHRFGTTASTRSSANSAPRTLGSLRIDYSRWQATLGEHSLDLTPTEFQLLAFLCREPGRILSRLDLARGVWGDERRSTSRTIDAYVRRVNAKLTGHAAPRVLTIRGLGYQLAAPSVTAV